MLSFLGLILLGSLLLSLPISAAEGKSVPYLDALFTATTATCVTGLVTLPTFSTWSLFGQIVILILIQIGGLGVVTTVSAVMILLHKRMGIGNRLLLQDAFNLNSLFGIVRFVKRVVLGTAVVPHRHDYDEVVVGNLHVFTCKGCGHQYEEFDGELIG